MCIRDSGARVEILWTDTEKLTEENAEKVLREADGILVPGGFGNRGVEGKLVAAKYAREKDIPFLGICLGMQIAVIEFARNVVGWADAASSEFAKNSSHPVIDLMPDQHGVKMGGTMRLGAYPCAVQNGTLLENLYGASLISERHRHRYEFNNEYREELQEKGLCISGVSPDGKLVEAVELPEKRFYVGVQFHPEFKSRPNAPHPLFAGFIRAALKNS